MQCAGACIQATPDLLAGGLAGEAVLRCVREGKRVRAASERKTGGTR